MKAETAAGPEMLVAIGPKWDLRTNGADQLSELNAMERQQDTNLWASSAIYLAATAVLLAAAATAAARGTAISVMATVALGGLGLVVTAVWWITAERAHTYEDQWLSRAQTLEQELEVPPQYAVWGGRPEGLSARNANRVLRSAVGAAWTVVIVAGTFWLIFHF